jgi:predicted enzyme related to lactoylglutathione lyase
MNRIVHFELHSADPQKTINFFSSNFGWTFSKWEGGMEYWVITTGSKDSPGIDGGLVRSRDGQPRTVNTIEVADVDQAAKQASSSGGQVVVPKMAIPGVGWLAYCTDPTGNLFGIYKNDPAAK